ncbi:ACT domain-containing protein [Aquibium sp. LZ166]|uniref:ACT domain-containing protein n=1 Tax=Aquibium pacificus TaxID=3153579 RepID=A0ABV3SHE3_9HYPH
MSGETDLQTLLASMRPRLDDRVFAFASATPDQPLPQEAGIVMRFSEREGTTLVLPMEDATRLGIEGTFPCRMITLDIHSSLEAVGFLAAILPRLAAAGIGVNPVSAFHHDHLFVPSDRAEDALAILSGIAAEAQAGAIRRGPVASN